MDSPDGEPGLIAGGRRPLLALGAASAAVFGLDTWQAVGHPYLAPDVPIERFVQAVPWGGLVAAFGLVDWLEGLRQVALAALAIGLVLLVNRRAAPLILAGALSGGAYTVAELLVRRPRPAAALVHVVRHTSGFSYPSGHAVFIAWFCILLIVCLAFRRLSRPLLAAAWFLAAVLVLLVCVSRVYEGEHWPSDVVGGLSLGLAWTSFSLCVPWLSSPVLDGTARRPLR